MPSYEYLHQIENCNHEWEETKSIKYCLPTPEDKCPKCGETGNITLLVSGGSGRHKVELGMQEYRQKIREDAASFKREALKNENTVANLIGESKFNANKLYDEKHRR